jgi:heterotetrameric sarcosine oxidase delta subunit
MSFLLTCPNCGVRRVDEFRFGGEYRERPEGEAESRDWAAYLYERANLAGPQREWWYHRQGCKSWFIATRDTRTNTVIETTSLTPAKGVQHVEAPDTTSAATAGVTDAGV